VSAVAAIEQADPARCRGLTASGGFANVRRMSSEDPSARHGHPLPVFALACWFLALVVLSQLVIAGLALAERFKASKQVRVIEREVPKYITVELPAPPPVEVPVIVRAQDPMEMLAAPRPDPRPLAIPGIADPRAERLVLDARSARVAGDMGMAILKLEEALIHAGEDPVVHYEMGLVHEQMGVYDIASQHYEKVFQAGIEASGNLYELAAAKLRDGFAQPADMLGKLSLGRVRIFKDPEHAAGERTILSIPVQKAPDAEIDVGDIEVVVTFFHRNGRGEIHQLEDLSWVEQQWVSLPFDWAGGEETLRMSHIIPRTDALDEHLFGSLNYYGQVVSLVYQDEVLDVQAWPRDLAARIPRQAAQEDGGMAPEFLDPGFLPPDFDPDNPLLPMLPE
jgi:hypothetical protein